MLDKLEAIKAKFDQTGIALTNPEIIANQKEFGKLSKEYRSLEKIVQPYEKYKKVLVCELNSGQFATYLRSKVPGEYLQFNKVQGQPFTVAELEEAILKTVNS